MGIVGYFGYKNIKLPTKVATQSVPTATKIPSATPDDSPSNLLGPRTSWEKAPSIMREIYYDKSISSLDKNIEIYGPTSTVRGWWFGDEVIGYAGPELTILIPDNQSTSRPNEDARVIKITDFLNKKFLKDGWVLDKVNTAPSHNEQGVYSYTSRDWKCSVFVGGGSSGFYSKWYFEVEVHCFNSLSTSPEPKQGSD